MIFLSAITLNTASLFAEQDQNNMPPGGVPQIVPQQIQWYTDYNQALQVARQSNKPILLFFTGSDWCGWCKKMVQEVFSSPDFVQAMGNNFVFVDVDFPMNKQLPPEQAQQNNQLKQENGVTGYPTVVIKKYVNNNLTFLAETGYRPGGGKAYADYLNQLLQ